MWVGRTPGGVPQYQCVINELIKLLKCNSSCSGILGNAGYWDGLGMVDWENWAELGPLGWDLSVVSGEF